MGSVLARPESDQYELYPAAELYLSALYPRAIFSQCDIPALYSLPMLSTGVIVLYLEWAWSKILEEIVMRQPTSLRALKACAHRAWDRLARETIRDWFRGLPDRMRAVIASGGEVYMQKARV